MQDDDRFWDQLRKDLERIIKWMRPYASPEWRDDAVQNTLLRIMRLLQAERKEKQDISQAYAKRVAFCTMANMWNPRQEELLAPEVVDVVRSGVPDPEANAAARELGLLIEKHLRSLNDERRRAVQLCVVQGHSVPEAARILGFDRKKTENLVNRGRSQLRQSLREELAAEPARLPLLGWTGP